MQPDRTVALLRRVPVSLSAVFVASVGCLLAGWRIARAAGKGTA